MTRSSSLRFNEYWLVDYTSNRDYVIKMYFIPQTRKGIFFFDPTDGARSVRFARIISCGTGRRETNLLLQGR